ncbi:MAG: 2-hydroxyacyl-CoA dehydratase [Firmicutes bacterium]|nr:2-hydroxyacyl-CoA dehydratase [Bacillota bacterium]
MGLDIGSTTIKAVVLDDGENTLFSVYQRHFSDIRLSLTDILNKVKTKFGDAELYTVISGSGGLGISQMLGLPFFQEVSACAAAVEARIPKTDVVIELGGEDAKIIYFSEQGIDQRMNGACAGGTGAFIDQMASLLQTDAQGLNELAKNAYITYPIASRCGVFAKTDIQPLLNQGAAKEDIAASVFQAVVNQTIVGLAAGKPIRGTVAFLGGPLHYLDQLTACFIKSLKLTDETAIIPEDGHFFVAWGAAKRAMQLCGHQGFGLQALSVGNILDALQVLDMHTVAEKDILPPLFRNEQELQDFRARHAQCKAPRKNIEDYMSGRVFIGIDAGSTTSKAVVIDKDDNILYSYYGSNQGEPLELCVEIMKEIYKFLPEEYYISNVGVTGYGEALIQSALKADFGVVETMAHYRAAKQFLPEVDFILDIGGQDMKAIRVRDGVIDDVILNEACSSGCGSFIETFAQSLGLSVEEFSAAALKSQKPVDMGSRCTVFMNSKVKQAQKEGATVEDISAGLSYSVIKNALYKVIKLRRAEEFGQNVILQGGVFRNEAVRRAFELETGVNAVCPDIAGLMGAYGAALLAKEKWVRRRRSSILSLEELEKFSYEKSFDHCGKCTNNCLLTRIKFNDGRKFVSGNRCEKGMIENKELKLAPNLFDFEYNRLFAYQPWESAPRGKIGIPRVLNMYDNYPFWHTLLTRLGFEVVLSPQSSKRLFEKGMESIPSEAVCYPAKLVHGHIEALLEQGIDLIFYPCVMYEHKDYKEAENHYNCPVVSGYPEVIRNNMDAFIDGRAKLVKPFVNFDDKKKLLRALQSSFLDAGITLDEKQLRPAIKAAYNAQYAYKNDLKVKMHETLEYMEERDMQGVILAGRPYHLDPEINHGIPNLFSSSGIVVIPVTMAALVAAPERPLRVVDQWVFHSRLYAAATLAANNRNLELVQLVSFGCGIDAITSDQVSEILHRHNKLYTSIKIDEGDNLGAARIRVRSLKMAIDAKKLANSEEKPVLPPPVYPVFTKEMKKEYTILAPQMSPIHFNLLEAAFKPSGYKLEILPRCTKESREAGLKYVHNDACYPCLLTTGQFIDALQSGKYDVNKTAVIMSQTGGQCRATNYIALIRKALRDAGFPQVPVISLSTAATQKQPGFTYSVPMVLRLVMAIVYGDILMKVLYRVRPYALDKDALNALYEKWAKIAKEDITKCSWSAFNKHQRMIIEEFDAFPIDEEMKKPKVGLVGEILVKYSPDANNNVVELVESLGGEAVMPSMLDFFCYGLFGNYYRSFYIEGGLGKRLSGKFCISALEFMRRSAQKAYAESKRFLPDNNVFKTAELASEVMSVGHSAGEGWFLTGEMLELIEQGVENIICMQPFACLPNHITGRGMIKELRRKHPEANIVAVDYDPGASETNQLNRIKLMMEQAFRKLHKE